MVVKKNSIESNNKKISWEYAEDFYCCWKYIETFIERKEKVSAMDVAKKIQPNLCMHNINSVRAKLLNIKSIMLDKGIVDSLQNKRLSHKSNNHNIKAMDEICKGQYWKSLMKKYKKLRILKVILSVIFLVFILGIFCTFKTL